MSTQLPLGGGWNRIRTVLITAGFLAASFGSVYAQDCSASAPTVTGVVTNVSCNGANNGSINMTPSGGLTPFSYLWSNGATTQDVSGLAPGNYSVTVTNGVCQTFGVELVNNSGFESGNTGFSSSYSYCNSGGCLVPEGRYAIGSNPNTFHSNFFGSPNAGNNFLVVNGIGSPNTAVWCQTITVEPNTVYNFSTWVASVNVTSPALLQFSINGTTIGNIFQAPAALNDWDQFFAVWNSGANTTASICVVNQNTTASGNDFGLDNISFMECINCSATQTFTVTEPAPLALTVSNNTPVSCNGLANGTATVAPTGGTAPYSVLWSNGQTGLTASNLAPNTYTATVTDARGCTRSVSVTITQPAVLGAVGAITSSYNGQAISCNGATNGTATVTPSGGTAPYTYIWSTGATTQSVTGLGAGTHTVTVRDARNCSTSVSVTLLAPPVLSSSTAVADIVNCNGANDGSVSVTPTGGTAPYTYAWSNGATTQTASGVGAGTYTVTVTDANGCTSNNSVNITQPAVLSTTAQVTSNYNGQNVGCNSSSGATPNGVISATPTGGTAPYMYVWSNGATTQTVNGVGAGTYTVTVTDVNGCTATASVTVTEPPVLTSNGSVTSDYNGQDVSCNGSTNGTITVTPGGGTAPYTYLWSTGATTQTASGVGAGTYTVTITDANGCTTTSSVTVTQPAQGLSTTAQVVSNYNGEDVSCNGSASGTPDGTISATSSGGTAPYTYVWSNAATTQTVNNVGGGTYTVTVTDANGCTATASATVTEPPVLTSNGSVTSDYNGQDVSCNGSTDGNITVTPGGGTAPYTYLWSTGATTQTATGVGAGTYSVTITDANGCTSNASVTVTEPTFALSTTAQVVSNYNGEDVSCNGSASGTPDGIISATPNGGTAPYTYAWSNGATTQTVNNVGAGTYTVTVTDANGCSTTASVTVTEPPVLTSNGSVTSNYNGQDVSCNGSTDGTITVTPGGGTAPYTYLWSNGATTQTATGVGAGTYTVTITDANGCTSNASVTVTEPSFALTATAQVTSDYNGQDVSCNGANDGSVTATASGGTAPYTYAWSNGATTQSVTGLGAGAYTVTVTDANACTATANVTVSEPTVLASTAQVTSNFNGQDLSCNSAAGGTPDGVVSATPTGGTAPYTYLWSNGATTQTASGVGAGTYTVTVTDANGCTATASVTVTEPPVLTSNGSVTSNYNGQDVSCNGSTDGTITVTPGGGTAPYTYLWSNGSTTQAATGVGAGTYTVTITDANGCTSTASVTVTEPAFALSTTAQVVSDYNGQDVSCNGSASGTPDGIISATPNGGTAPYTYAWSNGATTQTVNNVGAGTYTVTVTDANGCTTTASVTVTEPPVLTSNGSVTSDYNGQDVSCNGSADGTITVTPGGGTAPYLYLWNTGATTQTVNGVGAGTYAVTITDANGCTSNASVTVTEPTFALSATAQVVSNYNGEDVSCNGSASGTPDGIISATPNGGTAPYTYSWSNGATTQTVNNVGAGTYTVTVTDVNGCTTTASVTVTEPPVLTSNGSVTSNYNGQDVSCNGSTDGTITVTPGGGTAPYTYLWSNGVTTQTNAGVGAGTYSVTITDANGCTSNASVTVTEPTLALSTTAQVVSNYNGEDVSCNGSASGTPDGIISATPNGGTAPYTYAWSNGATMQTVNNVGAGTYTVTVTDANGCTTTASVTVTEPPVLTSNGSVTSDYNGQDVSCNGSADGTITVTPGGGTAPYTYLWSNGAATQIVNNVGAGTYTVTITDANGCTSNASVTVTEPAFALSTTAQVVSDYNGQDVSCNGSASGTPDGIISATPNGGTAPYTYAWNNGATTQTVNNVGAGTYTVTVTDVNGCTATASVTVTEPPVLTSNVSVTSDYNGQDVSCNGSTDGTITVTPGGGTAPYTYLWSNGVTTQTNAGVGAGTYSVTITDANGCTSNASVTVTEPAFALSTIAQVVSDYNGQDVSCNGSASGTPDGIISATPNGGTAPYTYAWSNGATTQTVNNVGAGTYTVTVTDVNGCTATASVTVTEPPALTSNSSVTSNYNGQDVSCNGSTDGSISVIPGGGTLPYTYLWNNGATTQSVGSVGAGTYTVTITDANGCTTTSSVTVTQPALPLTATAQVTSDYNGEDVSCNAAAGGTPDGVISATPNGGTAPYTYAWSTGATTQTVSGVGAGTYTVTVTDVNGCSTTASVTVTQPTVLTSTASVTSDYNGQDVSCNGSTDGSISVNPNGGTAPYTYLWNTGATTQSVTGLGAGTYTVIITDANGCSVNASVTVTEPAQAVSATASITSDYNGQDVSCNGSTDGSVNVQPAGGTAPYTYLWNNGSTTQTVTGLGVGTYGVTVTDVNGCASNTSVTVTQPVVLSSTSSVTSNYNGQDVSCNGAAGGAADGVIHVIPAGGTIPYTYDWSNGSTTQTTTGVGAGTYTVTVTDANGCISNSSVTVTEPTVLGSSTSVTSNYNGEDIACNGGTNAAASVTPAGGTAPYTYDWSTGAATQNISGLGAGTYTVTVTDVNGCTSAAAITVTEPAAIQVVANVTQVLCFGNSTGAINLTVTGGVGPYTYTWSDGSTAEDVAGLSAGAYTVTVTDANGCTTSQTIQVTQPAQALGGLLSIDNVSCFGGNNGGIQMTASGGTAPYTYDWTNGGSTAAINGITAGSYTVTITDDNGCLYNASGIVQEPAAPIAVSGSVTAVGCFGGNNGAINLTVTGGTPAYSYQWAHGPQTQDVNGLSTGTYSVTVTDSKGCIDATYSVTIPQPQAALAVTGVLTHVKCYNESNGAVNITVTGGTAPYSYVWNTGAVTEDIQNISQGTYSVTVTDANGCQHTSYVAQINQPAEALQIDGTVDNINCFGGVTGGVNLSVTGGEPGYTYQWSNGSNGSGINNVPAGQYSVTVDDGRMCRREATFLVNQPPLMFIDGNVQDNLCYGTPDAAINLSMAGGVPGYTYEWSNGAVTEDVFNLTPGNYTVSVTDANGCNGVAGFTVFEAIPLNLQLDSIHQIFIGNSVELVGNVDGGTGSYTYSWWPDDETLSCLDCQTTVASPLANTNYILTVTDGNGCTVFDNTQVLVNQDIFIPNVFTPNGNGTNDTFAPVVRMAKECSFSIFNRWGELIYSSLDADHGWDGNFNGKPVQVDVYVYHVKVLFHNGIEKVFSGNVTVLR